MKPSLASSLKVNSLSQLLDYMWVLSFKFLCYDNPSLDCPNLWPKILQYFYHRNKSPCFMHVSLPSILHIIIRISTWISNPVMLFHWLKIYSPNLPLDQVQSRKVYRALVSSFSYFFPTYPVWPNTESLCLFSSQTKSSLCRSSPVFPLPCTVLFLL